MKVKTRRFSGENRSVRKDNGNTVKLVCTGKYRTSESCQHSNTALVKAREKSCYTKLRLERGEGCLPVKTIMLYDRMKMAIPHRKYVKTLQDSGFFFYYYYFFHVLTFRIWKEKLILWLGRTGNGDENGFKNTKFDLLA